MATASPTPPRFETEDLLDDRWSFTVAGAPERSTGWQDSHVLDLSTGEVEFFDAEANALFPCSPIGDLAREMRAFEAALEDDGFDDWDPADDCPVPLTFANTGCHR